MGFSSLMLDFLAISIQDLVSFFLNMQSPSQLCKGHSMDPGTHEEVGRNGGAPAESVDEI